MQIYYRKNKKWSSLTFKTHSLNNLDLQITKHLTKKHNKNIDIVDIQVNTISNAYIITIFYAKI